MKCWCIVVFLVWVVRSCCSLGVIMVCLRFVCGSIVCIGKLFDGIVDMIGCVGDWGFCGWGCGVVGGVWCVVRGFVGVGVGGVVFFV